MDLILAGSRPEICKGNHLTIGLKKRITRTSAIQLYYRAHEFWYREPPRNPPPIVLTKLVRLQSKIVYYDRDERENNHRQASPR
jgi:hypothetical protein